ncbi:hypothetical protein CLOSACC_29470 [Clostridium saccharobutylicum]|nr:hypothetical protein CLOSC_29400 [Clostridium saccharobutylicum]AQS01120.1 hypothetical protein CSACC_29470 [Clostridium saccharobutylicum]AQS15103.1 hypothetical protein CLOSACC_29470 [Clostridium saccharobutylicum]NOV65075.1 hypothetical protein [Clostridium saccharobutylicum]OAV40868.1 hypothetical protein M945_1739 [Clostridium saccharobutylicum DSM 13864]
MNHALYLIQEQLDKKFLNLNIEDLDKHKYNLLISEIIYVISTIIPISNTTNNNLTTEFTQNHILINVIGFINTLADNLCIYLEIADNTIKNIEFSILC